MKMDPWNLEKAITLAKVVNDEDLDDYQVIKLWEAIVSDHDSEDLHLLYDQPGVSERFCMALENLKR